MTEVRFGQAINRALADAMAQDSSVILLGEDVGEPGGPFGVTRGLLKRFGAERVRDTPISEAAIVGAAVGAAMTGLRPVVEIMFMDFVTLAMDALVNQAAKARFMFGGQVSVPIFQAIGAIVGFASTPTRQTIVLAKPQRWERQMRFTGILSTVSSNR